MKRTKKLTRKERREVKRLLEQVEVKPVHKAFKQPDMMKASFYLQKKAVKKHEKAHHRQEKRAAKEGKKHVH